MKAYPHILLMAALVIVPGLTVDGFVSARRAGHTDILEQREFPRTLLRRDVIRSLEYLSLERRSAGEPSKKSTPPDRSGQSSANQRPPIRHSSVTIPPRSSAASSSSEQSAALTVNTSQRLRRRKAIKRSKTLDPTTSTNDFHEPAPMENSVSTSRKEFGPKPKTPVRSNSLPVLQRLAGTDFPSPPPSTPPPSPGGSQRRLTTSVPHRKHPDVSPVERIRAQIEGGEYELKQEAKAQLGKEASANMGQGRK